VFQIGEGKEKQSQGLLLRIASASKMRPPWGAVGGNDRECSSASHISQLDGFVNVDRSRFPTTQAGERL